MISPGILILVTLISLLWAPMELYFTVFTSLAAVSFHLSPAVALAALGPISPGVKIHLVP